MGSVASFDEFSQEYMCCCGNMHVKNGVKCIIGLGVLGLILPLLGMFTTSYYIGHATVGFLISVIAIGCLIAAVVTEKAVFVLPYLIMQIVRVLLGIVILMSIIANHNIITDKVLVFLTAIIMWIADVTFFAWFTSVIYGYYKFLKEKADIGILVEHA